MAKTSPDNLSLLSVEKLIRLYQRREISPVDVVRDFFDRVSSVDKDIHSVLAMDPEGSMRAAREAEQFWMSHPGGDAAKPLCGIPVTVKDTLEAAGMPTTYGSLPFKNNLCPDSAAVTALRAAGALVVAKTNTSEFALSTYCINRLSPPTVNPLDKTRTAGGSSGGSAASVAAGLVPVSIGTDSAGSIRIPASFCGIFGIKPSFGIIPFTQRWRASPTRSHIGVVSSTARDAAITMQGMVRNIALWNSRRDAWSDDSVSLDKARIVYRADGVDYGQALKNALAALQMAGVTVEEAPALPIFDVPGNVDDGPWAFSGDQYCAAERMIPNFFEKHSKDLTEYAYPIHSDGRHVKAWQYRKVLDASEAYRTRMLEWFQPFDFLLTPCCPEAPIQPATIAESGLGPRYPGISIWNLAGNPVASVPFGVGEAGMPVSIQVIGRHGEDRRVLALAEHIESLRPLRSE